MARFGENRVSDLLDYERDIKGKRLIRLYAGVGAGKNYWIVKMSQELPELRILLITSRVNVANTQALKMGVEKFLDIDCLTDDDIWGEYSPLTTYYNNINCHCLRRVMVDTVDTQSV